MAITLTYTTNILIDRWSCLFNEIKQLGKEIDN